MHGRLLFPLIAVVLLALVGLGSHARVIAQDATPTQGHPLIGTWLADTEPENTEDALDVFLFTADGSYVELDANGDASLGVWEATGATTATLTIVAAEADDEGNNFGSIKIRASIEVSADGNSFTAEYTIEFIQPDGTSSGEAGPGQATGVRMTVEAPGTPTITFEELFAGFEEQATPEATPVA